MFAFVLDGCQLVLTLLYASVKLLQLSLNCQQVTLHSPVLCRWTGIPATGLREQRDSGFVIWNLPIPALGRNFKPCSSKLRPNRITGHRWVTNTNQPRQL